MLRGQRSATEKPAGNRDKHCPSLRFVRSVSSLSLSLFLSDMATPTRPGELRRCVGANLCRAVTATA